MDALSIGGAVVDAVVRHADGRPVLRVHVRVGVLHEVAPESLAFYFDYCALGSPCEGAVLEQELVSARLACSGCRVEWEPETASSRCPRCDASAVRVVTGEELEIASIVVREEETACSRNG